MHFYSGLLMYFCSGVDKWIACQHPLGGLPEVFSHVQAPRNDGNIEVRPVPGVRDVDWPFRRGPLVNRAPIKIQRQADLAEPCVDFAVHRIRRHPRHRG